LGEAVNGLACAQAASGIPTTVVLPLHRAVREIATTLEPVGDYFAVGIGPRKEVARLFQLPLSGQGPRVFLLDHQDYFDRPGSYGSEGSDYADNARRFALFVRAALAVLPTIAPTAEIVHAHDWHAALAPAYLRTLLPGQPYYDQLATVLSVHNAGFQGQFPADTLVDLGLAPELCDSSGFEWCGGTNLLRGGIAFSDAVVTVSPTHADELRTIEGGFGLHESFDALGDRLIGILNGIDLDVWNPQIDAAIVASYSRNDLAGKQRCKTALQRAFGLPERDSVPLLGMSSRLTTQKGLDLILGGLIANTDAQFVFLGCGESRYEKALTELAANSRDRIGVQLAFTDDREHELMAGADILLMPSLYEPCGLTQMRAQLYGTLPVARRVGGLADTIDDDVTGFLFDDYSPDALQRTAGRATDLYRQSDAWHRIMRQAMLRGFGWRRSAESYARTYRQALAHRVAEVKRGDALVVSRPKRFGYPVTRSAPSAARESPPRGGCASGV
jgi:starch synthase